MKKLPALEDTAIEFAKTIKTVSESAVILTSNAHKMLDIGCGSGFLAFEMRKRKICNQYVFLDIRHSALLRTHQRLSGVSTENCSFIQADIKEIEFAENSFDIIVSVFGLSTLTCKKAYEKFVKKSFSWLTHNGVLILGDNSSNRSTSVNRFNINSSYGSLHQSKNKCDYNNVAIPELSMLEQISLLERVGFSEVDILYKEKIFATYYGIKM